MAIATLADVEARVARGLTAGEKRVVPTYLDDLERQIIRRIPDLIARTALATTDSSYIDPDLVKQVEAGAVTRVLNLSAEEEASRQGFRPEPQVLTIPRPWIYRSDWALLGVHGNAMALAPILKDPMIVETTA